MKSNIAIVYDPTEEDLNTMVGRGFRLVSVVVQDTRQGYKVPVAYMQRDNTAADIAEGVKQGILEYMQTRVDEALKRT